MCYKNYNAVSFTRIKILLVMAHPSENSPMNSYKKEYSHLFSRLGDGCLVETLQQADNDLMTILTLKIRMVNELTKELGLPLSYINYILSTCTPVHPEIAQELHCGTNKQDNVDALLAQDFVQNEKLLKLIKSMCKNGHTNMAHGLLAMDGLGGKLNHLPNLECKKYLENLKYSLSGEQGRYDREVNDDVKRAHVYAVRKVYQVLDKYRSNDTKLLVDGVYQVMRLILKEVGAIDLPNVEVNGWSDEALTDGVNAYKDNMKEEYIKRYVEILKIKIVTFTNSLNNTSTSDEEDVSQNNKRQKTK